ncbi:hypothetical protein OROMI_029850 [Orobanche minor]
MGLVIGIVRMLKLLLPSVFKRCFRRTREVSSGVCYWYRLKHKPLAEIKNVETVVAATSQISYKKRNRTAVQYSTLTPAKYVTSAHGPPPKYVCVCVPHISQAGTRRLSSASGGPPPPLHKDFETEFNEYFYGTVSGPTHIIIALSWPVPYRKYIVTDLEARVYVHEPWFEPRYILNEALQQMHVFPLSADFADEWLKHACGVLVGQPISFRDVFEQSKKYLSKLKLFQEHIGVAEHPQIKVMYGTRLSKSIKKAKPYFIHEMRVHFSRKKVECVDGGAPRARYQVVPILLGKCRFSDAEAKNDRASVILFC